MDTVQVLMHTQLSRVVEHVRCRRGTYGALVGLTLLTLFCLNAAWMFVEERASPGKELASAESQVTAVQRETIDGLDAFVATRMVTETSRTRALLTPGLTVAGTELGVPQRSSTREEAEPLPIHTGENASRDPFRPAAWVPLKPDRSADSSQGLTMPADAQLPEEATAELRELNAPAQAPRPAQATDPYGSASDESSTWVTGSPASASSRLDGNASSQAVTVGGSRPDAFRTAQAPSAATFPATGPDQGTAEAGQSSSSQTPESVGVPPPREQPQFLRRNSVLLKPGNYQWEIGLQYTTNETFTPFGQLVEDTSVVANVRQVNRTLTTPIEFRLGIAEGWQGSVGVPIGWSGSETSLLGLEQTDDDFGFGDFAFSLTKVMREGNADRATLLGLLAVTIPTGDATLASTLLEPGATLGRGFWSLTTGATALKNFDPLVVFGSVGYLHNFEGDVENSKASIDAGDGFFYRLGVGFAVNSRVSLNTAFSGAFLDDVEFDGIQRGGTSREPLSLRIAATILQADKVRRDNRRSVEPFLNFGLTNSAIDSLFGISWTF